MYNDGMRERKDTGRKTKDTGTKTKVEGIYRNKDETVCFKSVPLWPGRDRIPNIDNTHILASLRILLD